MDQFNMYSKKVMQYFLNPKNMGVIKDADGIGTVGNPRCGDVMKVYIKIGQRPILAKRISPMAYSKSHIAYSKNKNNKPYAISDKQEEYIKDIKVQTLGCGAAIATSSMITEMVKGKSLENALKVTNSDVAKKLGGLPPVKMHCSVLAKEGIEAAVKDYRKKPKTQITNSK